MINLLRKIISYFTIDLKKPITPTITNTTPLLEISKDIAALTLLQNALKELEQHYRSLYTKATKNLIDNKSKSRLADMHDVVNVYHKNITTIENELLLIEKTLQTFNQKVIKDYLKLNTKYDTN